MYCSEAEFEWSRVTISSIDLRNRTIVYSTINSPMGSLFKGVSLKIRDFLKNLPFLSYYLPSCVDGPTLNLTRPSYNMILI